MSITASRLAGSASGAFALVFSAGCGVLGGGSKAPTAESVLMDATGAEAARATFTQHSDGTVAVEVTTTRIPAGSHGIHIHAVGSCDAPSFTSAGAHYNPANHAHGLHNPSGPHNGDLANMTAPAAGSTTYRSSTSHVTLTPGSTSLFDGDGSALVIHATADDQVTDPSGNSGARIACGVIRMR